jgi:hypothetical protein
MIKKFHRLIELLGIEFARNRMERFEDVLCCVVLCCTEETFFQRFSAPLHVN